MGSDIGRAIIADLWAVQEENRRLKEDILRLAALARRVAWPEAIADEQIKPQFDFFVEFFALCARVGVASEEGSSTHKRK